MTRIDINYGGKHYSLGDREFADVMLEVESIIESGRPGWLLVNQGSGSLRAAHLLITAGVPFVLVPVDLSHSDDFERSQSDHAAAVGALTIDPIL